MELLERFTFLKKISQSLYLRIGLYTAYFVLVFLIFVYLMFPFEEVFNIYKEKNLSNMPVDITAEKVKPKLPLGVSMQNANIMGADKKKNAAYSFLLPLSIPQLTVKVPFSYLWNKKPDFRVNASILGGNIYIKSSSSEAVYDLKGDIKKIKLQKLFPKDKDNFSLTGLVNGTYDLKMKDLSPEKTDGIVKLTVKNSSLEDLSIYGIKVPTVTFSRLDIELNIKNGKAEIVKAELTGDDLNGEMTGQIILNRNFMRSILKCDININISEKLMKDENISSVLKFLPQKENGQISFSLLGNLKKPRPQLGKRKKFRGRKKE